MIELSAVGYEDESLCLKAQALAQQLSFSVDKDANPSLFYTKERLTLKLKNFSLLYADFAAATWNRRKQEGKQQGLVRACKPIPGLKIIDATAGWGRDAAILASFGAEVLMLERHPVMAALLADALLQQNEEDAQKISLSLFQGSAHCFLQNLKPEDYPDVIYIDPMHPQRNKSALVKKDMQALQELIGSDNDATSLIQLALERAKQKVVVKWPQKAQPLVAATTSVEGKTVRFDIYKSQVVN